jgi:hypothetical protein
MFWVILTLKMTMFWVILTLKMTMFWVILKLKLDIFWVILTLKMITFWKKLLQENKQCYFQEYCILHVRLHENIKSFAILTLIFV